MKFTIEQARKYAGLTQGEMAKRLNISKSAYLSLENDISRAKISQIVAVSEVSGIPIHDIFLPNDLTIVRG